MNLIKSVRISLMAFPGTEQVGYYIFNPLVLIFLRKRNNLVYYIARHQHFGIQSFIHHKGICPRISGDSRLYPQFPFW